MSSGARRWSKLQALGEREQLGRRAALEAAVPERVAAHRRARALGSADHALDRQAPQPHEAGGVLVAEAVGGVVGGERVVVEGVRAAAAGHLHEPGSRRSRTSPVTNRCVSATNASSAWLQRAEPQAVVDELGVADLEALLLAGEVALEADRLEVLVGQDEGQARRALVGLPALDADPAVLDHVEAAPAVGADDGADPLDERDELHRLAVDGDRARPRRRRSTRSRGSVAVCLVSDHTPGGGDAHGSSISPHSMARPQRLSSIEYTFSFVAVIGMPWS